MGKNSIIHFHLDRTGVQTWKKNQYTTKWMELFAKKNTTALCKTTHNKKY